MDYDYCDLKAPFLKIFVFVIYTALGNNNIQMLFSMIRVNCSNYNAVKVSPVWAYIDVFFGFN